MQTDQSVQQLPHLNGVSTLALLVIEAVLLAPRPSGRVRPRARARHRPRGRSTSPLLQEAAGLNVFLSPSSAVAKAVPKSKAKSKPKARAKSKPVVRKKKGLWSTAFSGLYKGVTQ